MKKFLSVFIFIAMSTISYSQQEEFLRIVDVNSWWGGQNGSIDSITIMVEPKGMYAEIQLLVDYSTRGTNYSSGDSLEIQMAFHLPYEVEVVDLWLWFYQIPVQARMLDRWTATMIYESIVNRREDPVLLVRNSDTYYDMKIFPLLTNMPRRIKLTYLVPFSKMTSSGAFVFLPLNFMKLSAQNIISARVCFRDTLNFTSPSITELPQLQFSNGTDPYFGLCKTLTLPAISSLNSLTLNISNQNPSSNTYAGTYDNPYSGESYFEMEINLRDIFNITKHKKTLFMFDFLQTGTTLSPQYVVSTFKNYVIQNFSTGDSINILISGLYPNLLSNQWVSADSTSLVQFLNTLTPSMINTSSNLYTLCTEGVDFIKNHGNEGNIVLISSSASYTNTNQANTFISNLMTHMGNPKIPINIISIDDKSGVIWTNNNNILRGNQYLFSNIALLTGGEFEMILSVTTDMWNWYYSYHYTSYENMLASILSKLSGFFTSTNMFVSLQSGFTYAVYNINSAGGFSYFDNPYRICGKFNGSFPALVHLSAVDNLGNAYNEQINIPLLQVNQLDSTLQHVWAGQYLRELYTFPQTNSIINHVIQVSRNERVLSKYTALLAIEPGMPFGDTIAVPVEDPGGPGTMIEDNQNTNDAIHCNVFPNPASDFVIFGLKLTENKVIAIEIFNVLNQKVDELTNIQMFAGNNTYTFNVSEIPSGTYFYRILSNSEVLFSGKIVVTQP